MNFWCMLNKDTFSKEQKIFRKYNISIKSKRKTHAICTRTQYQRLYRLIVEYFMINTVTLLLMYQNKEAGRRFVKTPVSSDVGTTGPPRERMQLA